MSGENTTEACPEAATAVEAETTEACPEAATAGEAEQPKPRRKIDLGETIATTAALLSDMEKSGEAFNAVSAGTLDSQTWEGIKEAALEREQNNERVFGGELDALIALRTIQDEAVRADVHGKARLYWRRAATSAKVGLALDDSYDAATSPGADPNILNADRFMKQLKELLGVVVSLSEQHAELVGMVGESKEEDEEILKQLYGDRTRALAAEIDALVLQRKALGKLHFKKRKALLEDIASRVEQLQSINADYVDYPFVEIVERELPED